MNRLHSAAPPPLAKACEKKLQSLLGQKDKPSKWVCVNTVNNTLKHMSKSLVLQVFRMPFVVSAALTSPNRTAAQAGS